MIKLINDDFLNVDFSGIPPINVILNSPPYNVGISYENHVDTMNYNEYLQWSEQWIKKCYNLQPDDGRIIINIPFTTTPIHIKKKRGDDSINFPMVSDMTNICRKIGYKYYRTIVWKKLGSSKTCWGSWKSARCPQIIDPSEGLIIFYKKQWRRSTKGTSTISTKQFLTYIKNVWEIMPVTRSKHPAAYPLALANAIVQMFSYKEDLIMDNFLGSGTSGESAVRLGRNFIGIEKSAEYFQMAKERIDCAELQTNIIQQFMPNMPIDPADDNDANIW